MAEWACTCGALRVALEPVAGTRLTCYCRDCRAFPTILGHPEMLDTAGGMDLFQTTPDRLTILAGREHLACLRLTEGGLHRWYAACCGTPFANTLGTPGWAFASLSVGPIDDKAALGPIRARVHTGSATGPLPGPAGGTPRVVAGFLARTLAARLSGRWRDTPFFAPDGRAVARPRPITGEERARGYPPGPGPG